MRHLPGGGPRHGDDEEGAEGRVQDLRQGGAGLHHHRDLEGLDHRAAGALDQRGGGGHPRGARRGWLRLDGLCKIFDFQNWQIFKNFFLQDEFCEMMMTKAE